MISTGCLVPTFRMTGREIDELVAKLDPVVDRFLFVINDHDPVLRKRVSDRESNRISGLYLDFPVGKAEAIRRGLMKILREDYDIVLQVDGHQKQDAAQVPALLDELVHSGADMLVANRYGIRAASDSHRVALTSLMQQMVRLSTGYNLTDTVCGTRAYNLQLASIFAANVRSFCYGLEIEQLILASRTTAEVRGFPVESSPQSPHTAAEKLEDNFAVLLFYDQWFTAEQRTNLSGLITALKMRASFRISGSIWELPSDITFEFVGRAEDGEDSYSLTFV
jgi:hypothetical protein